jgi:hypothetical protein
MITGVLIVVTLMYKPKGILVEGPVKTKAWKIFGENGRGRARVMAAILKAGKYLKSALYWLIGRETR